MDGNQLSKEHERCRMKQKHHLSSQLFAKPETSEMLQMVQGQRRMHSINNHHLSQVPKNHSSYSARQRQTDEKTLDKIHTVMHRKDVRWKQNQEENNTTYFYLSHGSKVNQLLDENPVSEKTFHEKHLLPKLMSHAQLQSSTNLQECNSNCSLKQAHGQSLDAEKTVLPKKQIHQASLKQPTWNYKGDMVKDVWYDETEPEDDCVLNCILKLREKLGWCTEFLEKNSSGASTDSKNANEKEQKTDNKGEYVYCLLRNRNDPKARYNPYDLQVVSAHTAKQSMQYWTVSASYIVKVSALEKCEITRVLEWLSERKMFNKIFQLPLFTKFRIWKAFSAWKINVRKSKASSYKKLLTKELFFADEILQRCLIDIKELCEAASSSSGGLGYKDKVIVFVKLDRSCTYSLQKFCEVQALQRKYALSQLESLHDKVTELIRLSFLKVAEIKGAERLFLPASMDPEDRPLYAKIAEWRSILNRFDRFLKLVDKIFEEMLCRLVKTAVHLLLDFLNASYNNELADGKRKKDSGKTNANISSQDLEMGNNGKELCTHLDAPPKIQSSEPKTFNHIDEVLADIKKNQQLELVSEAVFEVNLVLTILSETEVHKDYHNLHTKVSATVLPDGTIDLNGLENSEETGDEERVDIEECITRCTQKPMVTMSVQPSLGDFSLKIQELLHELEQTIVKLTSFGKDPQLLPFHSKPIYDLKLSVDKEQDLEQQQNLRPWPNLELLLGTDSSYHSDITDSLKKMEMGMKAVAAYSQRFQMFCGMVEKAMLTDVNAFMAGEHWAPLDLRSILALHTEHVQQIKRMNTEKRINMMMVMTHQYQKDCLLHPEAVVSTIHSLLPVFAKERNLELMEVITGALKKLDKEIENVEEFVDHLTFLGRITLEMPALERQYDFVTQLYTIAKDYRIPISPEELALYQILVPSFQHLKSTVLICETNRDDNVVRFSGDLGVYLNRLRYELIHVKTKVNNPVLLHSETSPNVAKEIIQSLTEEVEIFSQKAHSYSSYRELLGSSISTKKSFTALSEKGQASQASGASAMAVEAELSDIDYHLTLRKLLWEMQEEWDRLYRQWKDTNFDHLNVDELQKDVNRITQTIYMLEKGLPENDIVPHLKQRVMDFKLCLPIIVALRNPCLRPRHWEDIQYKMGRSFIKEENFTLGNLLELRVFQYQNMIGDISSTATNEATLEAILHKVIDLWKSTDFRLISHQTDTSAVKVIASAEDVMTQLEESQATILTLKSSLYANPIKQQIDEWERKLNLFAHTLEEWIMCQKRWLYLQPIFSAKDIQRQLPAEAKLFLKVDQTWKDIMQRTEERPNALKAATSPGVLEILQASNMHLDKIQRCLEDYLETKRMVFPRFYFLSSEDLLDILSQSKNPNAIQPHLAKCFDNVHSLDIQDQAKIHPVVAMLRSAENETIPMPKNVQVRGPVEQWLGNVETAMFNTIKRHLKSGVMEWNPSEFKKWVLSHPGQVVLTVTQIMFYKECERSFTGTNQSVSLLEVFQNLVHRLEQLTDLASNPLAPHQQGTVVALLTILVHCRDVLKHLIQQNVSKPDDFEWTRQLHYEWNEQNSMCYVVQANASFVYGYEYLGCSHRLVITPLTDRCWLTLTGALNLHLGGAAAGPAGTGKTETVKDLAKALGKFCMVFNCFESLDYKIMGRLFSGVVQSGAWCCFDEFNRIDVEVLSVIASQLQAIKAGKDSQVLRFVFEGRDIRLNASCGVFITMNPSYKGRVDLPDNLKCLFRPVAMMVPDYGLIAEIMLFSEGFKSAKPLSRKIVNLYQLASTQLSQQDHYDFGMRAIKSVLVMAGQRRRASVETLVLTAEEESSILIGALQDANLPKLVPEDGPLFKSIMGDLFPRVIAPKSFNPNLEKAIAIATKLLGLQQWPNQAEKVKQLYGQILARHGVMLVGPTGGGKTAVRRLLQNALPFLPALTSACNEETSMQTPAVKKIKVKSFSINPKCVTLGELYGQVDPNTLEWSDGLLASAVRTFSKELSEKVDAEKQCSEENVSVPASYSDNQINVSSIPINEERHSTLHHDIIIDNWRWIILDGPVDTLWVENLNSVLDDTKTMCLANGERINLPAGMRFIFEVDTLSQASPATISRCAMVYMDPVDLGWMPYVRSWLSHLPKELGVAGQTCLQNFFDKSISEGLRFVKKNQKLQTFPVPEIAIVMTLCSILGAFIDFLGKNGGLAGEASDIERIGEEARDLQTKTNNSNSIGAFSLEISPSVIASSKNREDYKWFLQKNPGKLTTFLGKLFVFAFTWAVGGVLNLTDNYDDFPVSKDKDETWSDVARDFQNLVQELFEGNSSYGIQFPSGNRMIFSYFVDLQTGAFVPWEDLIPSTEMLIRKRLNISSFSGSLMSAGFNKKVNLVESADPRGNLICTADTVRYSFLTSLLLLSKRPVLLTGDSGVGKSMLIHSMIQMLQKEGGHLVKPGTILGQVFLHNQAKTASLLEDVNSLTAGFLDDAKKDAMLRSTSIEELIRIRSVRGNPYEDARRSGITAFIMQCTARSSTTQLQAHILKKLVRKGKDTLGAPTNKRALIFVDDLNMPTPDEYGAQPPLELILQFLELRGLFDTKTLAWKSIQDVTLFAACAPPHGGRNGISTRLLRHFSVFVLPHPSEQSLQHIFQVQLGRFLGSRDFIAEVQKCRAPLVSASIAIYYEMCQNMLPTPAKYHYTFNLRDLSKVIQGLQQAHESELVSNEAVALLFAHEVTRVFHDRLVNNQDREQFHRILSNELRNHFKVSWPAEKLMKEPITFGDFLDMNIPVPFRKYKNIADHKKLQAVLEEYDIRSGNRSSQSPMVFFKEAVEHITRAARVFRQPGGHMMLIGLDGTGKATCASLACYISGCQLYRLPVSRTYSHSDFCEDLKKVYRQTGLNRTNTVLLIKDSDIIKDSFLEDINCILNSGEVPGLFDKEEIDGIAVELKSVIERSLNYNKEDSREEMYSLFLKQVHQRLHIVLACSPVGSSLRQHSRTHPALLSCCTIDWYSEWTKEALLRVADIFIDSMEFEEKELKVLHANVAQVCVDVHYSVSLTAVQYWNEMRRSYYITPSSFLEFLDTFSKMTHLQKKKIQGVRDRFNNGLSKLSEATSLVRVMQDELVSLGPKIEEMSKDIEILMEKLQKDSEAVEQVRAIVKMEEKIMGEETSIVQEYAEQAAADLNAALPLLQKAISALDALEKSDISEIRVYTNPPDLVLTVMHAVCILLQQKPDWSTAKQLLGDPGFLKRLVTLDKDSLSEKVFLKLRRYSKHPDFTPEKVGLVSVACRSMCLWVLALEHYHEVHKMIDPKQKKVEVAQEALAKAQRKLKEKQKNLAKIEEHRLSVEQNYNASVTEKEELGKRKALTTLRLQRASILVSALADEKDRWKDSVSELENKLQDIVGDVMVSAACVTYCGAFTAGYRRTMVEKWLGFCTAVAIPVSPKYTLTTAMAEKNQVRDWQNKGLPPDQNSTENAIIMQNGTRWPLLIDPQGQAKKWICCTEGDKLRKVFASDSNYMKTVENAIQLGEPVLIQDIGEVFDTGLQPVLMKNIISRGGQDFIKIGDTEIEYNHSFRLYLTTQVPNPHFLPAVCIIVKLINFSVAFEGLQEQLLSSVVSLQSPELEQQHCQLLQTITADLFLLHELENRSLLLLQRTEGHILDDQDLIDNLQNSKVTSKEILNRIQIAEETEKEIDKARKKYLPVAKRGAILYFLLADLIQINYMYQFSLDWFNEMFIKAIQDATQGQECLIHDPSEPVSGTLRPLNAQNMRKPAIQSERRMSNSKDLNLQLLMMIDTLTENIYKEVSLALFADHQLCFSFMMCSNIMRTNHNDTKLVESLEYLPENEWKIFLHSAVLADMMDTPKQMGHSNGMDFKVCAPGAWLTDSMWKQCQYISGQLQAFTSLCESLLSNKHQWTSFLKAGNLYRFLSNSYTNNSTSQPTSVAIQIVPGNYVQVPGHEESEESQNLCGTVFPWETLTGFQKLILIKILKPESLTAAVKDFVSEKIGSKYLQSGKMTLREVYEKSNAITPLVFLLSPGMDPASQLARLAQEVRGGTLHLDMVSLGQGQGPRAKELINKAQVLKGRWVFLQNCHLAASFMPRLQSIINSLKYKGTNIDPQFRLWLSSKPDSIFPASILQKGIKIAVEPPQGLKKKLLHTFSTEVTESTFTMPGCSPVWKTLLFSLCFFNAVVQERKKYGPLGWNIPYTFTSSDLEVSILNLEMLLVGGSDVPWPTLRYLTGEVVYGGRVTDPWDRRCLLSILHNFYKPSVLQQGHTYSSDGVYRPISGEPSLSDCRVYIESLPDKDAPEVFGMDRNAENVFLQSQAQHLVNTIISIQPRLGDSSLIASHFLLDSDGQTQDEVILKLATDILKTLPGTVEQPRQAAGQIPTLRDLMTEANTTSDKGFDPLVHSTLLIVLRQEIDCFNQLLLVTRSSLQSLCCAVKGEILMTEMLEEIYNSLLTMKVPSMWERCSYESCKSLGSWIEDLNQRVHFFRVWGEKEKIYLMERVASQTEGIKPTTEPQFPTTCKQPRSFWLSGFFFPQGFLTAVLQNSARLKGVPIDSLAFTYHVQPTEQGLNNWSGRVDKTAFAFEGLPPPKEGVLVYGLFLESASWDPLSQALEDSLPNYQHCPMPEIHFLPQQISDEDAPIETDTADVLLYYDCPLYRTQKRAGSLSSSGLSTNFITAISLPTTVSPNHWVIRGTALLSQVNE
nr:PREDICTED: dynein heavy chain 14, axonemal isoform X2 [Lepisosteus oculatus]